MVCIQQLEERPAERLHAGRLRGTFGATDELAQARDLLTTSAHRPAR